MQNNFTPQMQEFFSPQGLKLCIPWKFQVYIYIYICVTHIYIYIYIYMYYIILYIYIYTHNISYIIYIYIFFLCKQPCQQHDNTMFCCFNSLGAGQVCGLWTSLGSSARGLSPAQGFSHGGHGLKIFQGSHHLTWQNHGKIMG